MTYLFCPRSRPKTVTLSDILVIRLERASDLSFLASLSSQDRHSLNHSRHKTRERASDLSFLLALSSQDRHSLRHSRHKTRASEWLIFFARALVPRPSLSQTFSSQDSSERVTYVFFPLSRPKTVTLSDILVTRLERASDLSFLPALSSQDRHSLRHSRYKTRASK